jgi:hypothetical protein
LQTGGGFAIVPFPAASSSKTTSGGESEVKKEFDEHRETLHNLISLLLTNTTIRSAASSTEYEVL